MLPTLQKYIFREMGRSFVLTTIGLTLVLSTCGGAVSIIPLQSLSAGQTLLLMALVVPISAAFTLPIAALFSATIAYGRLAADNEFTAVRSGGINLYVLFAPCLLLSLLSAVVTFMFFNFLIPGLTSKMRVISRESIREIVVQALRSGEGIDSFSNYRIRAERVRAIETKGDFSALYLEDVAFIEFESADDAEESSDPSLGQSKISKVGRAESAVIKFDMGGGGPQIQASLANVTLFDPERRIDPKSKQILLGPVDFSIGGGRLRPKHMSLPQLLESRKHPEEVFSRVTEELYRTQELVAATLLFDHLTQCFSTTQHGCALESPGSVIRIQGSDPQVSLDRRHRSIWLELSDVKAIEDIGTDQREYDSATARISLRLTDQGQTEVLVDLSERVTAREVADPSGPREIRAVQLGPFNLPTTLQERLASGEYRPERLWNKKVKYDLGPVVEKQRKKLRRVRSKYLHQIWAEIHVRTVYSISVLVLAVLGAALGIIFRGGQVLVAFGISFVPTLFVILTTIVGKNIAKGEGTLVVGLAIMWCGLIAVTCLDYVVFKKYLPR